MKSMNEPPKYLLCPQCGSRRLYFKAESGEEHFVFVLADRSIVYAKTGDPIPEDLGIAQIRCADCSWYGGLHKLTNRFMY
jgi:DNA-directed RNA polymerase subunit RPC12/RpoP